MNKGYWVVRVSIDNAEAFKEYATRAKLAIEKFGGKYVVRGGKFFIIEGKHDFERNVIVEFPSTEKAKECYNSNEYQKAKSFRDGKANFNAIIIEGY
ncbi:DUF1330 domain-containing protein [Pelagibacteraceae bacterium]|jgi:uncharacterized protein (DUF1330 family)|nr:DUF1330 domain-containing protein [Pelagibacteraceae bacterium]|tara:strand:- start:659 stop:949 length:291 start_codon:yes stop_codon:yes gene_type:complete